MNLEQLKYADDDSILLTDIFEQEAATDASGNLLYYNSDGTIYALDEDEE
jgi:hypothetical protein